MSAIPSFVLLLLILAIGISLFEWRHREHQEIFGRAAVVGEWHFFAIACGVFVLFGAAIYIPDAFLTPREGMIFLAFFSVLAISLHLIYTLLRRHRSGALLLNAGLSSNSKALLLVGILLWAFILSRFAFSIWREIKENIDPTFSISSLVIFGMQAFLSMELAFSKIELRQRGIYCWGYYFTPWHEIRDYHWLSSEWSSDNSTLLVLARPRFPIAPIVRRFTILDKNRDAINQILQERLPDMNVQH